MANIIVTGSSRGIGLKLAFIFAKEGHRVLALSRNTKPITALNHKNISYFPFDITATQDIEKAKQFVDKNWNTVDVLINNAGRLLNKAFLDTTVADFQDIYNVNVFGVANLTRVILPKMVKNSHVLTISSMGGVQGSVKFPGLSAYSSSKAAVITLTQLWAEEFKESGIFFNVMALGAVQTEMLEEAFPGYKTPITALEMANYIKDFALKGYKMYNGKLLQVSSSTP